ncbi:hypothetical protein RJ639_030996 [Escallonia herrerae]|uniref:Uncharacterized protein n=1 Tax=Escallonia herrerae TaxID=1293975 RepID=A0AA89BC97_9ASTE|nr:hypothetical protein RJ639_030996 [Escallonia herrerae]
MPVLKRRLNHYIPSIDLAYFNFNLTVVLLAVAGIIVLSIVILCCCRRKWLPLIAVAFWKKETTDYENVEAFVRTYGSQLPKHYSYGMMVLEMAGARKTEEIQATRTSEIYFPDWIFEQLELEKDLKVNDSLTEDEEEMARKMILVCVVKSRARGKSKNL